MRRRTFLGGASLVAVAGTPALGATRTIAGGDVDGIVLRGRWRARVTAGGPPAIRIVAAPALLRAITASRTGTTLTLVAPAGANGVAGATVALPRLRGLATSGDVELALDDPAGEALFLDLAGAGRVRARGSVPLLRVTTSGTVRADLAGLVADDVRAHARQRSRLVAFARDAAHLVALDEATIELAGPAAERDPARVVRRATARARIVLHDGSPRG